MSEKQSEPGENDLPEEVARLYTVAHAPGQRYAGFSASRSEVRERFRERISRAHAARAGIGSPRPAPEPVFEKRFAAQPKRNGAVKEKVRPGVNETVPAMTLPPGFSERPPAVVVFSQERRVGTTSVVASLGQALAELGEQVLLTDTALHGSLPLYLGAREARPGVLRAYMPSPFAQRAAGRPPIYLLNLEAERFPRLESGQDWLLAKLVQESQGLHRVLIDVAAGGRELHRLLALRPVVLVPVCPDVDSVAELEAVETLLKQPGPDGGEARVYFLLNQFDESSAPHRALRAKLALRLQDRLLQQPLSNSSLVREAMEAGMTVIDHAPESGIAEEYRTLAAWLRAVAPPAVLA